MLFLYYVTLYNNFIKYIPYSLGNRSNKNAVSTIFCKEFLVVFHASKFAFPVSEKCY